MARAAASCALPSLGRQRLRSGSRAALAQAVDRLPSRALRARDVMEDQQKNLFIAIALTVLIMIGYQLFVMPLFEKPKPPAPVQTQTQTQTQTAPGSTPPAPSPTAAPGQAPAVPGAAPATPAAAPKS